jgi:nitrogen fixation NifU-like protein
MSVPPTVNVARGEPSGSANGDAMSYLDDLYREEVLDHYRNPRNQGTIEDAEAHADGMNPLCGDAVSIDVALERGSISDVKFSGRGCAISQAATSMLTELVIGKTAEEAAALDKDDLLAEIPIPLTPMRLKCAVLGLTTLKLALHKSRGTPLPAGLTAVDARDFS